MRARVVVAAALLTTKVSAQEVILTTDTEYRLLSNLHLVDEVSYKKNNYQALIEVPAGTTAKWEVNHKTGHLEWEFNGDAPRNIKFLGYPGNYGFIPQSILGENEGGDGDPLDVIVLGAAVNRGSVQQVRIIGAIKLLDKGEQDDKIIALPVDGAFRRIDSLGEMMIKFPDVIEIIRHWFDGYKGSNIQFLGYINRNDAEALVEEAHRNWGERSNGS